jgi:hypothetical protein
VNGLRGLSGNIPQQFAAKGQASGIVCSVKSVLPLLLGLAIPLAALAIVPARPQQILCSSPEIVLAEIVDGAGADCRLHIPPTSTCEPMNIVHLTIRIKDIIADSMARAAVGIGETVKVTARVQNQKPLKINGHVIQMVNPERDDLVVTPPTGKPLTGADIRELFEHKVFIFGIQPADGNEAQWASVWKVQRLPWILGILRQAKECPRPVVRKGP